MKTTLLKFALVILLTTVSALSVQGFIPDDADGDGVPDSVDACPGEDASGFDRDGDGCLDAFTGARHVEYWGAADTLISYVINEIGAPGISDGSDLAAIQDAFSAWTALSGTQLNVTYGGTTPQVNADGLDRVNLVTFVDGSYPFSSLVLAVGLSTSFESDTLIADRVWRKGEIYDADMVLNPTKTFKVGGTGPGTDIQSVATHEAGHMLGISHTAVRSATMHYVLPGGLAARSLASDDELVYYKAYGEPALQATANRVSGVVEQGGTAKRIGGAVVFLIDAASDDTTGCEFTLGDGSFTFPGVPDGSYYVSIHPLNGTAPINFLQAGNINALVEDIVDTGFNPEWYDAAESATDDPADRTALTVSSTSPTADITIVTNIDATGPSVVSATPVSGSANVAIDGAYVVRFSERIDYTTVTNAFSFRDDATMTAHTGSIAIIKDDSVLVFTPSPPLAFSTAYTLRIDTDLTDVFGNPLVADFSLAVTTEAEPPLSLTSLAPSKGIAGTTLVINGRGFQPSPTVTVNGQNAVVSSVKPNQVVVTVPNGATTGAVVVTNADLAVSNALTFTVLSADEVARGYESGQVEFAAAPAALALTPSGNYAYVATATGAEAVVVNPALSGYLGSAFIQYPGGLDDVAVNADETRAYAINRSGDFLVEIMADPTTGPAFNTVLASRALGADPRGIVLEPSGDRAYVATDEQEIQVWDIRLGSPTYQQQVGALAAPSALGGAMAVTPAGDRLLAASSAGDLLFFDLEGDSLVTQVGVGADPRGIVVDPAGERAYVSHFTGDISVVNIQGVPFQVQDIATGGSLRGLAVTPAALYLYVTDRELDNVKIVDLVETSSTFRTVVEDIATPDNPVDISISPDGIYAFSALQGGAGRAPKLLVTTIGLGPSLASIVPTAGPAGTQVVLSGADFGDASDAEIASVTFNGTDATVLVQEFDHIVVTVPAGATSGPVQVTVQRGSQPLEFSNSLPFEVIPAFTQSTPRLAAQLAGPGDTAPAIAVSPKGDYLLVGGTDGTIMAHDIRPGSADFHQEIGAFRPFDGTVADIAITADGKTALAVTDDDLYGRRIPVINTDPNHPNFGKLRGLVEPNLEFPGIRWVETSPNGQLALAANFPSNRVYLISTVGVSDGNAAMVFDSLDTAPGRPMALKFHTSGLRAYIATLVPDQVMILDTDPVSPFFGTVNTVIPIPGSVPTETPFALDVTPDGSELHILTYQISGPVTRAVHVAGLSPVNGVPSGALATYPVEAGTGGPGNYQERLQISPRGDKGVRVMSGQMRLYDVANPGSSLTAPYLFETLSSNDYDYSPDGTRLYLASTFHDSVRVYDFYGTDVSVYYLAVVSGDNQNGVAGEVLPAPIRATTIGEGAPLPGLIMRFQATPGNGHFVTDEGFTTELYVATDQDGVAEVQWRLGPNVGEQFVRVFAEGIDQSPRVVNALAAIDPDSLPLTVAEVIPLNNSTDVSTTTAVLATFSRAIDPASIDASSLFVRVASDATLVPVTYGFTDGNRRVSLTPSAPLGYTTQYQVVYNGTVEDPNGGGLANPGQAQFTTRAKPPLSLAAVSPPSALAGVTLVLSGQSFDPVAANNTVLFNGVAATPLTATSSRITVNVPVAATTGTIAVQTATETSNTKPFTVLQPNTSPIDEVIATVPTGAGAKSCAVSPDGALVYSVSPDGDVVIPVDVDGLTTYASISVGDQPVAIVIHPAGTFAYVANFNSGTVSVIGIDPANLSTFNTVVTTINVGSNPSDIAIFPDGDRVLVANAGSGNVSILDGDGTSESHHEVLATVPAGAGAKSVAVSPDGTRIYVGNDSGFIVLDAGGYGVLATVPAGAGAKSLAVSPDGTMLFVLTDDGTVVVYDVFPGSSSENQVLATVPAGAAGRSVAVSADGTLLYVIQENSDDVLVFTIDVVAGVSALAPDGAPAFTVSFNLVDTFSAGADPSDIAIDPSGTGTLFIPNPGARTITIVNGSDVPLGQVTAEVHIDNLAEDVAADGFYVTGRVELPAPLAAQDIDLASVRMATSVPYVAGSETYVDEDNDGIEELKVKFLRHQYQEAVPQGYHTRVEIAGEAPPRTFAGEDTLRTVRPVVVRPEAGEFWPSNEWRLIIWLSPLETLLHRADVHVSLNDGQTWTQVADGVPNVGLWLWKTPVGYHDTCWILVTLWRHVHNDDWSQDPDRIIVDGGKTGGDHGDHCGHDVLYAQGLSGQFTVGSTVATALARFDIGMEEGAAVLRWETSLEEGMEGFAVARSQSETGVYERVSAETIVARGEAGGGSRYEWRDEGVSANRTYWYKLQELTAEGVGMEFGPYSVEYKLSYGLEPNMPNPFNPTTTIRYALAEDGLVRLTVYDVRGARVRELVNTHQRADVHKVVWDGTNERGERVSSGMYFYKLVAGKFTQTRKMMMLK